MGNTHRSCVVQPSSKNLPPEADGNKSRDLQTGIVQRMRDPGILSSKGNVSTSTAPPLRVHGTMGKVRQKESKRWRGWRTPRKQGPLRKHDYHTQQGYHTETGAACRGSARICTRTLVFIYYRFQFSVVYGIFEYVKNWV